MRHHVTVEIKLQYYIENYWCNKKHCVTRHKAKQWHSMIQIYWLSLKQPKHYNEMQDGIFQKNQPQNYETRIHVPFMYHEFGSWMQRKTLQGLSKWFWPGCATYLRFFLSEKMGLKMLPYCSPSHHFLCIAQGIQPQAFTVYSTTCSKNEGKELVCVLVFPDC